MNPQPIPEPYDQPDLPHALGGLVAAAHAVGLQDHKRLLDQNAKNVERSWKMGMAALGWTDDPDEEDDEMGGNVSVHGDTHIHVAPTERPPASIPSPQPAPGETTKPASRWLPWLLAAGLAAGNVGAGAWIFNNLQTSPDNSRTTVGLETE